MRLRRGLCAATACLLVAAPGVGALAAGHPTAIAGPLDQRLPDNPTSPELRAAQTGDVEVVDNEFDPDELTVEERTTVTWFQTGDNPHSVTADDGSFDSHPDCSVPMLDCMSNGDTFEFTFEEAGDVPYFCKIHGGEGGAGQSGVIVVEAATGATDPGQDDVAAAPGDDDSAALAAQESTGDALPVTGGPGVSGLAGSAMLGVAAGLWVLVRRRPGADGEDARTERRRLVPAGPMPAADTSGVDQPRG